MEIQVGSTRPVIEILIEKNYAESAKAYYELIKNYYSLYGPNPFLNLQITDKGSQNGIANTGSGLEVGDLVRGFFNATTYWPAAYYIGGNPLLITSWQPIGAAVSNPSVPDIPNPNPPPLPPAPTARNFSTDFNPPNFKIYAS